MTGIALFAALALAGCGRDPVFSREAYVFGTRVQILITGVPGPRAAAGADAVLAEFDRLHQTYHAWQPSPLTTVNDAFAAGRAAPVSAELADLIRTAQVLGRQGDGLFDPGIGRLVALWGFHSDHFDARLPDPARLQTLLDNHPSVQDVHLATCADGPGICAISTNRSVALDFGGYLKGVALDHAATLLKERGITHALINIGGNILALGDKDGHPWRIGIQHPRNSGPMASLDLRDGEAIGTSGDYQRYFELNGRRYCHLIDPRSGEPASGTQSVTILIPPGPHAGALSDAASKPLFIAADGWPKEAQNMGVNQALRVDAQGRVQVTAALRRRLTFETPNLRISELP
ncbi:MAG: FAD:protein FMN transferase [Proteobacteria bacterium]|nr:FAD:protein FMN transferase [Pseudomonadota bacterium]HQR04502.1 FAD:protein FMN transferase [Rhodocyclaceae bacterium]